MQLKRIPIGKERPLVRRLYIKTGLVMRLVTILILASTLQISAKSAAQKITLDKDNASLGELLKEIHKQTGYLFLYDSRTLEDVSSIDIHVKRASLQDALDKSIARHSLGYLLKDSTILVFKKNETKKYLKPSRKVEGTVTDETGQPLNGVTVRIKGSNIGTITDANGKFSIEIPGNETVLQLSYLGFKPIEITVGNQSTLTIQMTPSASSLDQLVVVGYGRQKKVDMTGSVATISAKDIENRPITNLSNAMAGLVPGAYFSQGTGSPGGDGGSVLIRGAGTLSSTAPLVLIDGIVGSMNSVNPNDVKSVSVLKDAASAAIYGAQGGNGVILITTKKGKTGKPTVTYNGFISSTTPTGIPEFVSNSVEYMQMANEAYTNIGQSAQFSQNIIDSFTIASKNPNALASTGVPNYVAYPNTDWSKYMIHKRISQNHNISVSGGNENTHYLLSLGYLHDAGLIQNSGYTKYQFRFNLESKIGKNITVGTQTYGSLGNYGMADEANFLNYLVQAAPYVYPYWQGKYGAPAAPPDVKANNLLTYVTSYSGSQPVTYLNTTWYAKVQLLKGLTFEPKVNYTTNIQDANYNSTGTVSQRWNFANMTSIGAPLNPASLSSYSSYQKTKAYTLESILRYHTSINDVHNIDALAGFNQYYWQYNMLSTSVAGLIDPSITAISSATVSSPLTKPGGYAQNWSMRSFFGRINYNYKEKYLLEANIRRDGSSRFGPSQKYGNFPSISVGWNLAKESFMRSLSDHNIQSLKLRASYGVNGNSTIGNNYYPWQALYNPLNYAFAGTGISGLSQVALGNNYLHWETMKQLDFGLDAVLFQNLELSVDWFRKHTSDIIYRPAIDITHGTASAPYNNFTEVGQNGIELTANWHKSVGDFNYSVGGNFSYQYNNMVLKYKGPLVAGWTTDANGKRVYSTNIGAVSGNSGSINQVIQGHMINEFFLQTTYRGTGTYVKADGSVDPNGGPETGMIRTPQDYQWVLAMQRAGYTFAQQRADPSLPQDGSAKTTRLYYGDLIYADNNNDSIYGNTNDREFMHVNTTPKYIFGLNLSASWKGIDVSMLWAGAAGFKRYWYQTFYNSGNIGLGGQIPVRLADHYYRYDPAKATGNRINGAFPRLKYWQGEAVNKVASDFWFYDASYVKLKNLQIGYTLPESVLRYAKNYIKGFRIYFSGENLLTLTKYPGPDPEAGTRVTYPLKRQYAVGVNVTF